MTPQQIDLVKSSFALALPKSDQVAKAFYDRLFAAAPDVQSMFRTDMASQGQKLMLTLATIVSNLDRLDVLLPEATELARRHVSYGAVDAHYATVGNALIATLRAELGGRFTPETEAAWTTAYATLSEAMIASTRTAQ